MCWEKLPRVEKCCCCSLFAGTILIALVSILRFAGTFSRDTVGASRYVCIGSGAVLCIAGILLLIGAITKKPQLILVYMWASVIYLILYAVAYIMAAIAVMSTDMVKAGINILCILISISITLYFITVVNSFRETLEGPAV